METVELVKQIKGYDTITISIFTPYRGTVLQKVAVKNGWLDKDHITIHTTSSSVLKMPKPYLSSKDIDGLMKTIPLYVYFPKSSGKIHAKLKKIMMKERKFMSIILQFIKKIFKG